MLNKDIIKRCILKWIGMNYGDQEMDDPCYDIDDLSKYLEVVLNVEREPRKCSECNKEMSEGYCIENGMEYYCSDECLYKHYTQEEFDELYDDGNGDSYWTEWEEPKNNLPWEKY